MIKATRELKARLHLVDARISDVVCQCVCDPITLPVYSLIFLLSGSFCNFVMMPKRAVQMHISHLRTGALKAGWSMPELPHNRANRAVLLV